MMIKKIINSVKNIEKDTHSFLYYLTKSKEEVPDMVQEVLLKVVKNIKHLKKPKNFKSWLNKIIIRHYYDCMRKQKKFDTTNEISEEIYDRKNLPASECINNELTEAIRKSIIKLDEPYRMAIIMREFKGLTYEEIAQATKTNIGTVKSRISRARSRLKEYIKPVISFSYHKLYYT